MAILREIGLDANGDLAFEGGDLVILEDESAVAQRIATRLKTIKGEWVFDQTIGTPWFQSILGARPRRGLITQLLRQRVADTQGVDRIDSFSVDIDSATRGLTVTGSVVVEGNADQPLSIEVVL